MEAWPELLKFKRPLKAFTGDVTYPTMKLNPDQLTPSLGDMVIRDFVRRIK